MPGRCLPGDWFPFAQPYFMPGIKQAFRTSLPFSILAKISSAASTVSGMRWVTIASKSSLTRGSPNTSTPVLVHSLAGYFYKGT